MRRVDETPPGNEILTEVIATEFRRENLRLGDIYIVSGYSPGKTHTPKANLTRITELGESTFSYLTGDGRSEYSERYEEANGVVVRHKNGKLEIVSSSAHINKLYGVDRVLRTSVPTTKQISKLKIRRAS